MIVLNMYALILHIDTLDSVESLDSIESLFYETITNNFSFNNCLSSYLIKERAMNIIVYKPP